MIERRNQRTAKVGMFAVAHDTYWAQFEGLEESILGFHQDAIKLV